ncbi:hypothetical protein M5689_011859 [Euphorbia peplus]|nr:hypothetical protein M5689_011859 [Euphorbia peplus]
MFSSCCIATQTEKCFEKHCCSCVLFSGACFWALVFAAMTSLKNRCKGLFKSRGCFGCCIRPATTIAIGNTSKRPRNQDQTTKQESTSDEFWSTSPVQMDPNGVQSQKSLSSVNVVDQPLDPVTASASTSNPPEFVNHGFLLWKQTRQQWITNRKSRNKKKVREPTISWNATYETLLGSSKRFPQPIPLPEMVDFLVDTWEQEGLYD